MARTRVEQLSRDDLLAENARLTALLEQAGIDARAERAERAQREAGRAVDLAVSRAEAVAAREAAAQAREDALDAVADLAASGRLVAELTASQIQLRTVLDTVPVGIILAEAPSGRIIMANRRIEEIFGGPATLVTGPHGDGGGAGYHADGRPLAREDWPLASIIGGLGDHAQVEVHYQRPDGGRAWVALSGEAIKDGADATVGAVIVAADIHDRKQAEAAQEILNRELGHRLKNTLTLVQSIAAQTLRNAPSLDAAREALAARLVALGHAHDALLSGRTESAEVEDLVRGSLALHADAEARYRIQGPPIAMRPSVALSLGMLMHELATNAVKYGALSNDQGRVSATWSVEGIDAEAMFRLVWRETGGPPVTPPERRGFGSRLIERGLSGGVGQTQMEYPPEGVVCTLTAPMDELRPDHGG